MVNKIINSKNSPNNLDEFKIIRENYKVLKSDKELVIDNSNKTITIEDYHTYESNNEKEILVIKVRKGSKIIFKSYSNSNKIFYQEKDSFVSCFDIGQNVSTKSFLRGENAVFNHKGLLVNNGSWNISVFHEKPNTNSNIIIKNIVEKNNKSVINGLIKINKSCFKAEGHQKIDSLLLDKSAKVQSLPMLEIFTDDVICTHAATISNLDEEELFYIQSRGINSEDAKQLIVSSYKEFDKTIKLMNENENIERLKR